MFDLQSNLHFLDGVSVKMCKEKKMLSSPKNSLPKSTNHLILVQSSGLSLDEGIYFYEEEFSEKFLKTWSDSHLID